MIAIAATPTITVRERLLVQIAIINVGIAATNTGQLSVT